MSELTVASRYAKSIVDLAEEQGLVEVIRADMGLFLKTLRVNQQLKAVLANPIISHSKKIKILDDVFLTRVNKLSIAFFKLMINKGRGEVLYLTAHEFVTQYDIIGNITKASVVSASTLSEENKNRIIADIHEVTKGTVLLDAKVDPSLIGGFILTVGDRQIDTSISGDLKKIRKEFAKRIISN